MKTQSTQIYSEILPGHVMVVTIPDLTNLNTANPFAHIQVLGCLQRLNNTCNNSLHPL